MQLRQLHILCDTTESTDKIREKVKDNSCILRQWETQNEDSLSLYIAVDEQDQELFDALQDIAEQDDAVQMIITPIEASFPKRKREEKRQEQENKPGFFDIASREVIQETVTDASRINGSYLSLTAIAAFIATIALIQGNMALLIGAMVITPLLGPNLALAFATATTDHSLTRKALQTGLAGIVLSLTITMATATIMGKGAEKELTALLTGYGYESIAVAISVGAAATLLLLQGTASAFVGIAVAIAFLPPLAITGLALTEGNREQSLDGLLLFLINLAAFNLAAKTVLFAAGIRPHPNKENGHTVRSIIGYICGWALALLLLAIGISYRAN